MSADGRHDGGSEATRQAGCRRVSGGPCIPISWKAWSRSPGGKQGVLGEAPSSIVGRMPGRMPREHALAWVGRGCLRSHPASGQECRRARGRFDPGNSRWAGRRPHALTRRQRCRIVLRFRSMSPSDRMGRPFPCFGTFFDSRFQGESLGEDPGVSRCIPKLSVFPRRSWLVQRWERGRPRPPLRPLALRDRFAPHIPLPCHQQLRDARGVSGRLTRSLTLLESFGSGCRLAATAAGCFATVSPVSRRFWRSLRQSLETRHLPR